MENSRFRFTKKSVEKLALPEKKPVFRWDTEVRGFGIKLNPSGKIFIAQGRAGNKTRRITIGEFGVWTVDNARKKAQQLLLDMANGIDPNLEKKIEEARAMSLEEVVEDYIKDRSLKQSSKDDINRHLNTTFKDFKNQPITKITRDEVLRVFRLASESSKAQANQGFRLLRAWLNYAKAAYRPGNQPILLENPVQALSDAKLWHSIKPRTARIPTDKIGKAWNCIQELMEDPASNTITKALVDAAAFILLTGCRFNEAATLPWDQVNLDEQTWTLPDPKNHNPVTFPLSSQAFEILARRPRINEFVFPSYSKTKHIVDIRYTMQKISKEIDKKITAHDLRRTFRAIAGECGIELYRCKLLMNHKLNQDVTISAYTETSDLRYLQPEIQKIGDWIERQGKLAEQPKVVDIDQHRKKAAGEVG